MLHLFFAVAFSAVPLTLYIPPLRSLNLFLATVEGVWKESSAHTVRMYPRFRKEGTPSDDCNLLIKPRKHEESAVP
ncbi:hypothetical protein Sango_0178200 [Sesamum angolense]|uniref:Secreted protein n=1 Tax=Sesamum angolense TaxID=2727404 RepID=A0AAE1XFQ5_9LAMI|nr:hypothetical protein Sango_0178200 [Sesamum angolense]